MVLVDTSVWIDHLRSDEDQLIDLLNHAQVLIHPMVIGELACGNLQNRQQILALLKRLPLAVEATHDEVFHCLDKNKLMGKGADFVDMHLLASTLLSPNTVLWTRDRRLNNLAKNLKVDWKTAH